MSTKYLLAILVTILDFCILNFSKTKTFRVSPRVETIKAEVLFYGIFSRIRYTHTKKPDYCRKLHDYKKLQGCRKSLLQEMRQAQYNRWSRAKEVYSGNYLPSEEKKSKLLAQGWVYEFPQILGSGKPETLDYATYHCLRNDQYVRSCKGGGRFHWHWFAFFKPKGFLKWLRKTKKSRQYLNDYGELSSIPNENHLYR